MAADRSGLRNPAPLPTLAPTERATEPEPELGGNRVRQCTATRLGAPSRSITQRALPGGALNGAARVSSSTWRVAGPQPHCRRPRVEPGPNCRPLARCERNDPGE